jgi:hypothetical protein
MSRMPAKDPVLGDKQFCDALDLIIVPRVRDLGGGFSVGRALPHSRRQMVGPFIFFDQMGRVQFVAGQGLDVRPHAISVADHTRHDTMSGARSRDRLGGLSAWL